MAPSVHDLSEQLTWHWSAQIRPRLVGLEDDEYFWEPVPGSWSIRPGADGSFAPDWVWPPPEPAPVTTIAWRLGHIWMTLAQRADFHFGGRDLTMDKLNWPGSAEAGLAALDRGFEAWTAGVAGLSDERAETHSEGPPGTLDGQFPLWSVVLHVNREVIHHGAEVALLRDIYRARQSEGIRDGAVLTSSRRCANCGASLPADQPDGHNYCDRCAAAWQRGRAR